MRKALNVEMLRRGELPSIHLFTVNVSRID